LPNAQGEPRAPLARSPAPAGGVTAVLVGSSAWLGDFFIFAYFLWNNSSNKIERPTGEDDGEPAISHPKKVFGHSQIWPGGHKLLVPVPNERLNFHSLVTKVIFDARECGDQPSDGYQPKQHSVDDSHFRCLTLCSRRKVDFYQLEQKKVDILWQKVHRWWA
jgi:hypothetical protein